MSTEIVPKQILDKAPGIVALAQAIEIRTTEDFQAADTYLTRLTTFRKTVEGFFKPHLDRAKASLDALREDQTSRVGPVKEAEGLVKNKMLAYQKEQERLAEVERRRLQAEAMAKAEADRKAKIEALKAEGAKKTAAALQKAELVVPEVKAPEVPKLGGVTSRKQWKYRVLDIKKVPIRYLQVNHNAVQDEVTAMKEACDIPGIETFSEEIAVRRG